MSGRRSPLRDFLRRYREGLLLVFLVSVSLIAISRQLHDPSDAPSLGRGAVSLMVPFQKAVSAAVGGVQGLWEDYVNLFGVREENRQLREEVNRLRTEVQELREELFRAGRLEEFAAYRSETGLTGVAARVIGESPDSWTRTMVVNRGRREGIERGLPVVTPEGLVGRVVETTRRSSIVRLILDRSSRVPVVVVRSRARAILEGENSGTCRLKYLDRTEDVLEGDQVITSGLAGIFPRGVEVGTISQVTRGRHGLYQDARLIPKAPLSKLEDVLILHPQGGREAPPL